MYVVTCERRPVPLEHLLYTGPADDLLDPGLLPRRTYTVLDHNGVFSDERWVELRLDSRGDSLFSGLTHQISLRLMLILSF